MPEPTYEQKRIYRVIGHPAFAFTDAVPTKKLDVIVPDAAEAAASAADIKTARQFRQAIKAKRAENGNHKAKFSERNALEVMARIGIVLNYLEEEKREE